MTPVFVRFEVLDALQGRGLTAAEVYLKSGRSRRFSLRAGEVDIITSEERGWAVRAGDERCSFFRAGTGRPRPEGPWPDPDGFSFELPAEQEIPPWRPPASFDAPLAGERDGLALLEGVRRALKDEAAEAVLSRALLEDGASDSMVTSSRGVDSSWRSRLATIRLEVADRRSGTAVTVEETAREARDLRPAALARAAADRLLVTLEGRVAQRDRGEMVLSPEVASRLLTGLGPLLVGPEATALAEALVDRGGRLGSSLLTVADDGRHPSGLLAAPVDGEGVPTRKVTLIEEGRLCQPLLSWWQHRDEGLTSGCSLRASWRDLPTPGPTHCYVQPDAERPATELVAAISRGYYLLAADGAGWFDFREGRFALPVSGFAVKSGAAQAPVASVFLCGSIGALLRGIQAVARDLHFFAFDGMIGSPSLLVAGLELRSEP